jgi:hypothetical protein
MELKKKRGRPSNAEMAKRLAMKEAELAEFQDLELLKPEVGPFEAALSPFLTPGQMTNLKLLAGKQGFEFEKWLLRAIKIGLGYF